MINEYPELLGLIIVPPHGTYIANGSKTIIVKSKYFKNIIDRPLLLIENKYALGIIYIDQISEINLQEFRKSRHLHLITEDERHKWWPGKTIFYEYNIAKRRIFVALVPIEYKTGPQVFVRIRNVKPLQKVYIGTSGYNYSWWKDFYQNKTNTQDQLEIYTDHFNSLEINGSFYGTYKKKTWRKLKDLAPTNFIYSAKVNRSITHYYQFQKFKKFWSNSQVLTPKLKCLLFQFPEHFKYTDNNMERLQTLETPIRSAFEFRDASWQNDVVYDLFRKKKKWSIVISYHGYKSNLPTGFNPKLNDWPVTSDFVYVRLHGTTRKYEGSHKNILKNLTKFVRNIYDEGIKYAFVYFNNTDSLADNGISDAIVDAEHLRNIIGF